MKNRFISICFLAFLTVVGCQDPLSVELEEPPHPPQELDESISEKTLKKTINALASVSQLFFY